MVVSDWERAERIIAGEETVDFDEASQIVNRLRKRKSFAMARRLLQHVIATFDLDAGQWRRAHQLWAMATYHDGEHLSFPVLDAARAILEAGQSIEAASREPPDMEKSEHLGIAAAISKQRFSVAGRLSDLEEAKTLSDGAVIQSVTGVDENGRRSFNDNGYACINAAFVCELLAARTFDEGRATALRAEADLLRRDIVHDLERKAREEWSWWEAATYAEAKLGQGDPKAARDAIFLFDNNQIVELGEWERETTARQLDRLAMVHSEGRDQPLGPEVAELLGHIAQCAHPRYPVSLRATFGLALSGGGLRASLFHLGVLARLAEADLLRHVSVLSCVSGGSIVGAHYYLALQELLERKPDDAITRADYVELVRYVIDTFVAGMARDVRRQVGLFRPRYVAAGVLSWLSGSVGFNRTVAVAEALDELFFERVGKSPSMRPRPLRDLLVTPAGEDWFNPKLHNWRRAAKVPVLLINATSLNTGYLWQFTQTYMGEPNSAAYGDGAGALPRLYLSDEVPENYRNFPLSTAVAASMCVPGLLSPVSLFLGEGPRMLRTTVRLVDGGVRDNQGVLGLLGEGCDNVFVSDASGQLQPESRPRPGRIGVLLRSALIQAGAIRRVRLDSVGQHGSLSSSHRAWVVHLTQGLREIELSGGGRGAPTPYGMPYGVQRALAELRTDIDRFSDIEADALMLSAYRMTGRALQQRPPPFGDTEAVEEPWRFLAIAGRVDAVDSPDYHPLLVELTAGSFPARARGRLGRAMRRRAARKWLDHDRRLLPR